MITSCKVIRKWREEGLQNLRIKFPWNKYMKYILSHSHLLVANLIQVRNIFIRRSNWNFDKIFTLVRLSYILYMLIFIFPNFLMSEFGHLAKFGPDLRVGRNDNSDRIWLTFVIIYHQISKQAEPRAYSWSKIHEGVRAFRSPRYRLLLLNVDLK